MRVVEIDRHGGPEVLTLAERPAPRPGPGQVVAQVVAAGVNYADIYQREGVGGYARPAPFVAGGEGAGTVTALGEGVTGLAVGDQVAWRPRAATPSRSCCPPTGLSRCRPGSPWRSPRPRSCRG